MSDAARAAKILDACSHAQGTRLRRMICVECLTLALDAYAAEQTAALRHELGMVRITCDEQHAPMLEQTTALRAALDEEHRSNVMYRALPDPDGAWSAHESGDECAVCALLADQGQRAGEDRETLKRERDAFETAIREGCCLVAVHACPQANTLAAVERARQS